VRGERAGYLELARRNAEIALATELGSRGAQQRAAKRCASCWAWPSRPQRIECFDISHTMGEATVASCVVFDAEGPVRVAVPALQHRRHRAGRRLRGHAPGLERRFRRALEDHSAEKACCRTCC
jgi:excinuclease ABC subunit C